MLGVVDRVRHHGGERARHDDRRVLTQVRQRDRHGVKHADEIHVYRVHKVHRLRIAHGHGQDAGVGHHDVEVAKLGQARVDCRLELIAVAHVGLAAHDPPAELLDHGHGLRQVFLGGQRVRVRLDLLADVDRDDVGALFRKPHGVAASLPACRSGDQRDLARHPSGHRRPP
jgi:hypothetical protein